MGNCCGNRQWALKPQRNNPGEMTRNCLDIEKNTCKGFKTRNMAHPRNSEHVMVNMSVNDRIYNHLDLHMHMEMVSILVLRYKSSWRFSGKYIQFQSVWGFDRYSRDHLQSFCSSLVYRSRVSLLTILTLAAVCDQLTVQRGWS